MSLESIALGAFGLVLLGTGYVFALRVETALSFQRWYAETVSWNPPSENPEYYESTYEHRKGMFRFGGAVLLAVGACLFAVSVYATFFVESFPQ